MAEYIPEGELYVQTPHKIIESDLSDAAVRMALMLSRYAGKDGKAFPHQETLAKRLGWSLRKVSKVLRELKDAGWLEISKRPSIQGREYRLVSPDGHAPACVSDTHQRACHEGEPEKNKYLPSVGTPRAAVKKPTRKQEAEQLAAEEAALDPATSMGLWDGRDSTEEPPSPQEALDGFGDVKPVVRSGRSINPDSAMGLAVGWRRRIEREDWAGGSPANLKALAGQLKAMLGTGLRPDDIRYMTELYATSPGMRNPRAVPWKDFLARRAALEHAAKQARNARAVLESPEETYAEDAFAPSAQEAAEAAADSRWNW